MRKTLIGIAAVLAASCTTAQLPPIVLTPAVPAPVAEKPAEKLRATIGVQALDADTRKPLDVVDCSIDGEQFQTNDQGYFSVEKDQGRYTMKCELVDYAPVTREISLTKNTPLTILMKSTKPAAPPKVEPAPNPVTPSAPPVVEAPKPAPCSFFARGAAMANCPAPDTTGWSDDQFKAAFFSLLQKHNAPRTVNLQTLNDTKADVEALGMEWQHTSDMVLRPRLFLPVAFGADPYSRPYDVGLYGEAWQWIKRY